MHVQDVQHGRAARRTAAARTAVIFQCTATHTRAAPTPPAACHAFAVCDVYYCTILKAAGVLAAPELASQINCAEFHNLDVYRLALCTSSLWRVLCARVPPCDVRVTWTQPACGNPFLSLPIAVNTTATRPAVCIEADPDLSYCQIMGAYRMHLDNVNTMAPYPHMNEHCAALPLDYTRTPANC